MCARQRRSRTDPNLCRFGQGRGCASHGPTPRLNLFEARLQALKPRSLAQLARREASLNEAAQPGADDSFSRWLRELDAVQNQCSPRVLESVFDPLGGGALGPAT